MSRKAGHVPTKHRSKFNTRRLVGIGVIVIALIGAAGWKLNSNASSEDWKFYVSVHYGNPSQGDPETKTMVVDGRQTNNAWTQFRMTSVCGFSGPTADMREFLIGMSEQPEVRMIERKTPSVILVTLREPLSGAALTNFSNFMLQGMAETGLNNCGSTA